MRKAIVSLLLLLFAAAVLGAAAAWFFGPTAAVIVAVVLLVLFGDVPLAVALDARLGKQVGPEAMLGHGATVIQPFAARGRAGRLRGKVRFQGEMWHAQSTTACPDLLTGEVLIVGREGLTLLVVPRGRRSPRDRH